MERTKFRKAIQLLAESFGTDISLERIEIYYQHLGQIKEDEFANCINQLIDTESFFPPIAKFIDIIKSKIEIPTQAQVHKMITNWLLGDFDSMRDVSQLKHPVYQMMAEEIGVCDRFTISQEEFDNGIKYRYHRIVEEYKSKMISGEQLRLPAKRKRSLYPYASSSVPRKEDSGFKKLDVGIKQIAGKDRRI